MNPLRRLPTLGPRDRRALRLGGWIMVPALLIGLVLRPLGDGWLADRATVVQNRALLARELRLVADAPRDRELLRAAREALDASAPRMFGGAEAVSASAELARYVGRMASESGLDLQQAETQTALDNALPAPGGGAPIGPDPRFAVPPLRVSIRARGDVEGIVAFLQALENGDPLVRVERIAITAAEETTNDDGSLVLTATISGIARGGFGTDAAPVPPLPPAAHGRLVSRSEP